MTSCRHRYKVYRGDCWQHLRNIIIEAMATAGDAHIKDLMSESHAEFVPCERIDPAGSSVMHGAFNCFHHGGEYAKGRGREFTVYHKKVGPPNIAKHGSRV